MQVRFRMRISVIGAMLVCAMTSTSASAFTEADIRNDIIGKRIYLAVPMGGEFPLNYRENGQVDGSGEALGLGRLAKPKDTGRWWIDRNRLCQQFTSWYKGAPMCFDLERTGENQLKWTRDNGETGTARIGENL